MEYPQRYKSTRCLDCGKTGVPISCKGRCLECGQIRQKQAAKEMMEKKGPAWENWKKSMLMILTKEISK